MQPGLGVTTNCNLSGEAMDVFMYFIPIFEGFRQHFFKSQNVLLSSPLEIPFFFPLHLLNAPLFCKGTAFVLINQNRPDPYLRLDSDPALDQL